jgi:hypothetical protein
MHGNKERVLEYLEEAIRQVKNDEVEYILLLKSSNNIVHPTTCFLKDTTSKVTTSVMGYLEIMKNDLIESLIKN